MRCCCAYACVQCVRERIPTRSASLMEMLSSYTAVVSTQVASIDLVDHEPWLQLDRESGDLLGKACWDLNIPLFLVQVAYLAMGCALLWVVPCYGLCLAMGCALLWAVPCYGFCLAMGCALLWVVPCYGLCLAMGCALLWAVQPISITSCACKQTG